MNNKFQNELVKTLPSQWYVKCTDNMDDTPELAEWRKTMRNVSWNISGTISETGWWRDSGYELGTEISYDDFLKLVYNPWKAQQPITTLPEKWYVKCTHNMHDTPELKEWRNSQWNLSGVICQNRVWNHLKYAEGTEISYDDFLELVYKPWKNKNTNTMKQLDPTQTIKITKEQLYAYYEAATDFQKEYMDEHFKLSGTTTIQGIIGLYDIACSKWQPIIKKNHPECFPEKNKYFDLSGLKKDKSEGNYIFTHEQGRNAGFGSYHFLQVRGCGEYENKGFYLHSDYNWEIVKDSNGVLVLLPTKK